MVRGYSAGRVAYDARRRAGRVGAEARAWQALVRSDVCSYCRARAVDADHITGLSLGGDNRFDNFTGACRRCNRSKRDKPLLLWLLERQR